MLASSDHIVAISSDFVPILDSWGVPERKVTVIENWAPMDEIDLVDRPTLVGCPSRPRQQDGVSLLGDARTEAQPGDPVGIGQQRPRPR